MSQQSHDSSVVRQVDLPKMPPEILFRIFKYVVEIDGEQVLPSPYMRVSKSVGQHVAGLLTQDCTLQVECRHATSHHYWATSMYKSTSQGEFLRSPGLPTIKGSVVRWSKFRSLFFSAETTGKVDSVYIKLRWVRDLAFTIFFHHDQPPTIKIHAWLRSYHGLALLAPLRLDLGRWNQQPVKCSVEWIETFISDMRNQTYTYLAQHNVNPDRKLYGAAMKEMKTRQYFNHAVRLRRNTTPGVPKMLGIREAFVLRDAFSDLLKNRQVAREVLGIELEERFGMFEVRERIK
ncbi:hypothetical protein KCU95_g18564, partial [Aureobasidium melanogenum]